jgi:hypothetical protein
MPSVANVWAESPLLAESNDLVDSGTSTVRVVGMRRLTTDSSKLYGTSLRSFLFAHRRIVVHERQPGRGATFVPWMYYCSGYRC